MCYLQSAFDGVLEARSRVVIKRVSRSLDAVLFAHTGCLPHIFGGVRGEDESLVTVE